jgi:hypothetical protein
MLRIIYDILSITKHIDKMEQISNVELNRKMQDDNTKMYIEFELPVENRWKLKNEIIILDVASEQYTLDREELLGDSVIWKFNKSKISLRPLTEKLDKLYSEIG